MHTDTACRYASAVIMCLSRSTRASRDPPVDWEFVLYYFLTIRFGTSHVRQLCYHSTEAHLMYMLRFVKVGLRIAKLCVVDWPILWTMTRAYDAFKIGLGKELFVLVTFAVEYCNLIAISLFLRTMLCRCNPAKNQNDMARVSRLQSHYSRHPLSPTAAVAEPDMVDTTFD